MNKENRTTLLYWIILLTSASALVGSLLFSNYLGYAPCDLCWYQRICMYPLSIISASALMFKDTNALRYGLPLSLIGFGVAIYHVTIYTIANHINPNAVIICSTNGVSCTSHYIELFGFLSIPVMSLLAFIVINASFLMLFATQTKKD